MSELEVRFAKLQRQVRWLALLAVVFGATALGLQLRPRTKERPTTIELGDEPPYTSLTENGLVVAPTAAFDGEGVHVKTPPMKKSEGNNEAILRATQRVAAVILGHGDVGFTAEVDEGSAVVILSAHGAIGSRIEIDTDSGAWTIVRSRKFHDQVLKEDRRVLLPPLGP